MPFRFRYLAVAMILPALAACSPAKTTAVAAPLPSGTDMILSDGVRFIEMNQGVKVWDIRSDWASYSLGSGVLEFKKADAVYSEEGKEAYRVSGGNGIYDSKHETLSIEGDVKGKSASGYSLKTDRITYNMESKVAVSDAPVEIGGEGVTLKGIGLVADFAKGEFSIMDGASLYAEPAKIPK